MTKGVRRVKLNKGKQRELILILSNKFGSVRKMAKKFGIPYSTMKGYFEEVRLLPENLFNKILSLSNMKKNDLKISYLSANWGSILGGKMGMKALERKYPKKILQWRREAIKKAIRDNTHYGYSNMKKIKTPILDEKLAEFIGAYLGDGTLTKYQIRISGDYRYDYYYNIYLLKLIKDLFRMEAKIRREKNVNTSNVVVCSKNLCSFLNENLGINFGDKIKNKTIIPKEIIKDEKLYIACLRGLIDTDGSVSRRGRNGSQFCIQFTSHNEGILKQVKKINKNLKIFTFSNKTGIGTNKWENIVKYFQIVGSSNPKHIVRFLLRKEGKTIYRDDLSYYFEQEEYKTLNLPFILKGV